MKIQIDTKAKIIRIDETVKFDDLIKVLNKLLPKEWKDYSLETSSVIKWYNPIVWHYYEPVPSIYPVHPIQPWRIGDVTYMPLGNGGTTSQPICESIYNVDCVIN
jgi:hypothetical protein